MDYSLKDFPSPLDTSDSLKILPLGSPFDLRVTFTFWCLCFPGALDAILTPLAHLGFSVCPSQWYLNALGLIQCPCEFLTECCALARATANLARGWQRYDRSCSHGSGPWIPLLSSQAFGVGLTAHQPGQSFVFKDGKLYRSFSLTLSKSFVPFTPQVLWHR